jgi:proline dehydrogenase
MLPPVASRFVAGETAAEAIDHAYDLNGRGIGAILNLLGEHHAEPARAGEDTRTYQRLVAGVADPELDACVSVKPTQLGLDVGEDAFRRNLDRVVATAADHGAFVWIDMEDHTTTDATLDAYEHHAREHGDVGVCLQANLRRTADDLERLAGLPGTVRLVKGAYDPPADVAYRGRDRVDEAYRSALRLAFERFDDGVAVGSHDPAMIDLAADLHDEHGTGYEIQMLMGVREDAQTELARDRTVNQYVPYGSAWADYFARRILERKENAAFAVRALMGSLR